MQSSIRSSCGAGAGEFSGYEGLGHLERSSVSSTHRGVVCNHLELQLWGLQCPLLAANDTCTHAHIPPHRQTQMNRKKNEQITSCQFYHSVSRKFRMLSVGHMEAKPENKVCPTAASPASGGGSGWDRITHELYLFLFSLIGAGTKPRTTCTQHMPFATVSHVPTRMSH